MFIDAQQRIDWLKVCFLISVRVRPFRALNSTGFYQTLKIVRIKFDPRRLDRFKLKSSYLILPALPSYAKIPSFLIQPKFTNSSKYLRQSRKNSILHSFHKTFCHTRSFGALLAAPKAPLVVPQNSRVTKLRLMKLV